MTIPALDLWNVLALVVFPFVVAISWGAGCAVSRKLFGPAQGP